jgi:hypothetical protein
MTEHREKPTEHREKPKEPRPGDRRWNDKQGSPKDPGLAKTVERASSRYSATEQSEKKREREKDEREKDER